jgi:3',5'-cyclic AMP phosphodiesterase CpdA
MQIEVRDASRPIADRSRRIASMGDRVRFLQISDLHTMNRNALLHATGNISDRLATVMDMMMIVEPAPDIVLLTGDLVDRSSGWDYGEVLQFSELLEEALRRPVVAMMGNHDDREKFDALFGVIPSNAVRRPGDSHDHMRMVGGARLLVVDSSVPGRSYGELGDEQLEWIAAMSAEPAPLGTVLSMHHPPISSPMPQLRYAGLRNSADLANALDGSDVRGIVAGHYHHPCSAVWHGRLVWCGPSLAYSQDVLAENAHIRGWNHGAFSLIDVRADGMTASVVEIPGELEAPLLDFELDVDTKELQWQEAVQKKPARPGIGLNSDEPIRRLGKQAKGGAG